MFEKMPVFWSPGGRPPLRKIYQDLIKLRKQHPAFCNDEVEWVSNSAPAQVASFIRRDTNEEFLVLINLSSERATGTVDVATQKAFDPVRMTGVADTLDTSIPNFSLNGYSWSIYRRSLAR